MNLELNVTYETHKLYAQNVLAYISKLMVPRALGKIQIQTPSP